MLHTILGMIDQFQEMFLLLLKYIKQNPHGTIHIWHTLIPQEWWIYIRPILTLTPMTQWVQ
jgi:hypothetical protein